MAEPVKTPNHSQELSSPSVVGEKKSSPTKPTTPVKPPAKPSVEKFTIHDSSLIASLQFMKQNKFLGQDHSSPKFESVREAEEYAKESVVSAVKDKISALKSDISDLQKKGYELHFESIKLLHLPLKIKLWTAHPVKKDLEAMYAVFGEVEPKVQRLKKELEQNLADKEKHVQEQEKAWEAEVQQRKKVVQELSMSSKPKAPAKTSPSPDNHSQKLVSPSQTGEKKVSQTTVKKEATAPTKPQTPKTSVVKKVVQSKK